MGDRLAFYPAMSAPRRRRRGTGDGGGEGSVNSGSKKSELRREREEGRWKNRETENKVIPMTLKETVFHELETADEQLLEEVMQVIRSRTTPKPTMTITDAIAELRRNMSPEELDPNAEDIWETVRDRTPVSEEPRW